MGRLEGKVALISGGARGMGAAEARLFAAEGASVVVGDVLATEGRQLAESLGGAGGFVDLDVTDESSWDAAVGSTVERHGRLDVLVNNAGILEVAPISGLSAEGYMKLVQVNQLGVFLGMKAVAAPMQAGGGGSIINISSVAGLIGAVGHVAYASTKWAVRGMTKTAAIELGPAGIRVNSIHPGIVETPMLDAYRNLGVDPQMLVANLPIRRLATSEDVAQLALYLASDESGYSTGSEFVVDGGMTAGVRT
ncbi:MAG TPA: glucose 1-dehydrogenase [Acidimicrobiales bacterium]|nr:glucose 1-dehydrogenase [Acidimicrobiales bacterium]